MQNPELAGTVVVRFSIDPSGVVGGSELVSSTLATPEVENCIVATTRRWSFPSATATVVVEVAFELSPHGWRRAVHRDPRGGAP